MLETTALFIKVSLCFTQTYICWALFFLFARVEMTTHTHTHTNTELKRKKSFAFKI